MTLPIIQSLWIGDDLSNLEKLCIQSFLDHGHEFHLYTYADVGEVPGGVVLKDGNEILHESNIFRYRSGSYAGFSNWFRYALLARRGGFWVDMDVVCLKPFVFDTDIVFGEDFTDQNRNIHSCVVSLPPNHQLATEMEKSCRDTPIKEGASFGKVGGPRIFSDCIRRLDLQHHAQPFTVFFHQTGAEYYAFDNSMRNGLDFFQSTYALHISNEMLRRIKLDKNSEFDKESLIEQLKAKHRIPQVPGADKINSDDFLRLVQHYTEQKEKKVADTKKRRRIRKKISWLAFPLLVVLLFICWFGMY